MLSPIFFIQIKDKKIYLNETDFIPFSQTNLPEHSLTFKSNEDIIWEVKSTFHDLNSKEIQLEVIHFVFNSRVKTRNRQDRIQRFALE
jgi:hypothetical protein